MRTQRLLPILVLTLAIAVAGCPGQDQPVVEAPEGVAPTATPPPPGLGPAEAGTPGPPDGDTLPRRDTVEEGIPVPQHP
jgi:hypothetical protein